VYGEAAALGIGTSGCYTRNDAGTIISASPPDFPSFGLDARTGWGAAIPWVNAGGFSIFVGYVFSINTRWWYVRSVNYSILGVISSDSSTQQYPSIPTPPDSGVIVYFEPDGGLDSRGPELGEVGAIPVTIDKDPTPIDSGDGPID